MSKKSPGRSTLPKAENKRGFSKENFVTKGKKRGLTPPTGPTTGLEQVTKPSSKGECVTLRE